MIDFADGQGYHIQVQPRGQVGADRDPPLLLSRLPWNFKPNHRLQYASITLEEARTLLAKWCEEQYKWLMMFSQNSQTGAVILIVARFGSRPFQSRCLVAFHCSVQRSGFREVEIPEEIQRLSATVMLSATVKHNSLSKDFNLEDVTEMAKTSAAKFGKILSFKTRYHNSGHGRASTVAR